MTPERRVFEVIVTENLTFTDKDSLLEHPYSTVGVKTTISGKQFGLQTQINSARLTGEMIVQATSDLMSTFLLNRNWRIVVIGGADDAKE